MSWALPGKPQVVPTARSSQVFLLWKTRCPRPRRHLSGQELVANPEEYVPLPGTFEPSHSLPAVCAGGFVG